VRRFGYQHRSLETCWLAGKKACGVLDTSAEALEQAGGQAALDNKQRYAALTKQRGAQTELVAAIFGSEGR
jgi:hypothetical protein